MKAIKRILSLPITLITAWLLAAGFYQSMQMYTWAMAQYERVEQVAEVAENPITLFSRGK